MTAANTAPGGFGFAGAGNGGAGSQDEELDRAIAELRGVLHEDGRMPAVPPGGDILSSLMPGGPAAPAGAPFAPPAGSAAAPLAAGGSLIMNIPVDVQIVLGSAEMPVSELLALGKGSTVALDRRIGEPVDVVVNGRRIARGEITVLDADPSRFGIRLTEIIAAA